MFHAYILTYHPSFFNTVEDSFPALHKRQSNVKSRASSVTFLHFLTYLLGATVEQAASSIEVCFKIRLSTAGLIETGKKHGSRYGKTSLLIN